MKKSYDKINKNIALSVVMPSYKAENIIRKSLLEVKKVLDKTRFEYELICVVDGKGDSTYELAKEVARKYPGKIRVLGYLRNLGKGHAVRYGMAKARGKIIGFIDAGVELDPNSISMLLEHFEWYRADIIVGSKRHPASKVIYPWQRRILSFGYQAVIKILFNLNVKDTQVGMKFFKREVLQKILPRLLVKAFAFDIEMLAVSYHLGFKRIYEAPVNLKMKFTGGVSTIASKGFLKTIFHMLWDTAAVFYRLKIIHYYDDRNKDKWITPEYLTFINNSK